jgi:DNA-directed RNA polymerase subunit L
MKLRVVSEENHRLEMEFGGEGHTLLNLLQSALLKIGNVRMAGYSKPHPLMDRATLFVTLKRGRDFNKVLLSASADAKKQVEKFLENFEARLLKEE